MNPIYAKELLWIRLTGESRKFFESTLLPIEQLKNHPEMPKECWDVATGDAFYAGCEGIGHNKENGWYLVLWTPCDAPDCGDCKSTKENSKGHIHLLFMERGSVTIHA